MKRRKCHMTAMKAPGATPTPTPTPTTSGKASGPPPQAKGLVLEYNKSTKFIKKVYVCIPGNTTYILHRVCRSWEWPGNKT